MSDFPDMRFILIGDDGQSDPSTYAKIAEKRAAKKAAQSKASQNKNASAEDAEDDGAGQIAFGPFLAVAAPFMYLWGDALKEIYLKLVVGE